MRGLLLYRRFHRKIARMDAQSPFSRRRASRSKTQATASLVFRGITPFRPRTSSEHITACDPPTNSRPRRPSLIKAAARINRSHHETTGTTKQHLHPVRDILLYFVISTRYHRRIPSRTTPHIDRRRRPDARPRGEDFGERDRRGSRGSPTRLPQRLGLRRLISGGRSGARAETFHLRSNNAGFQ